MTINEVIICGRLVRDPELRYTPGGTAVVSTTVALDRYMGEGKDNDTDFIPIVAWRNQAEFLSKYFFKGKKIIVKGNLKTRTWDDQETGKKRFAMEVWAEKIDFADDKKQEEQSNNSNQYQTTKNQTSSRENKAHSSPPWMQGSDTDDEMPF